jgi:hypothetical protein
MKDEIEGEKTRNNALSVAYKSQKEVRSIRVPPNTHIYDRVLSWLVPRI